MRCLLLLPFRQGVIVIFQEHFSFRTVALVCLAKDHVELEFSLVEALENMSTDV